MAKEELAKKGPTDITSRLASFEGLPSGFEGTDADSFAKPFLTIIQPTSPQLVEDSDAFIEGAKPGMFFNTLTRELYGKAVKVISFKFERVYLEWKPDQGGFVGVHTIKEGEALSAPTAQFGKRIGRNNDNEFVETHTHYLLIAGREDEGPIIFSLASSGIKHSRKWLSNAKMVTMLPMPAAKAGHTIIRATRSSSSAGQAQETIRRTSSTRYAATR